MQAAVSRFEGYGHAFRPIPHLESALPANCIKGHTHLLWVTSSPEQWDFKLTPYYILALSYFIPVKPLPTSFQKDKIFLVPEDNLTFLKSPYPLPQTTP